MVVKSDHSNHIADAYRVTEESTVVLAAAAPPLIKLDDKHYKWVAVPN